jgi:hypothetical protein
VIPEDVIDGYLSSLFGSSEPGTTLHTLVIAQTKPGVSTGALGLPELETTLYAIDAGPDITAEEMVSQVIFKAIHEARETGAVLHFVGLGLEVHIVRADDNEIAENRVRVMHADRKLHEHPAAVEATVLYAACRDGRRWSGTHTLTGPEAGNKVGPVVRAGAVVPGETGALQKLIRTAVGIQR